MSSYIGPEIPNNGLVFHYDMSNSSKSWKGMPTTNLVSNPNDFSLWNQTNAVITPNAITAPDGTFTADAVTFSSVSPIARVFQDTAVTSVNGVIYTSSIYLKSNIPANIILSVQRSGPLDVEGVTCSVNTSWQRFTFTHSGTFTGSSAVRHAIYSYDSGVVGPTFYMWGAQLEQNTFASPFVDGSRSNTQAVVDLTGNNTITATSLAYNNDGSFEWANGANASLSFPSTSLINFGTGNFSLECWIYPKSFSSYTHMIAMPTQSTLALKANNTDGIIYFYCPTFTTFPDVSGWTLSLNTWNHVVFVRDTSVAYCYLNGILKGTKSGFTTSFGSSTTNIGNGYLNEYTNKKIGNVKIYNRALSATEVYQNYESARSRYGL